MALEIDGRRFHLGEFTDTLGRVWVSYYSTYWSDSKAQFNCVLVGSPEYDEKFPEGHD